MAKPTKKQIEAANAILAAAASTPKPRKRKAKTPSLPVQLPEVTKELQDDLKWIDDLPVAEPVVTWEEERKTLGPNKIIAGTISVNIGKIDLTKCRENMTGEKIAKLSYFFNTVPKIKDQHLVIVDDRGDNEPYSYLSGGGKITKNEIF